MTIGSTVELCKKHRQYTKHLIIRTKDGEEIMVCEWCMEESNQYELERD